MREIHRQEGRTAGTDGTALFWQSWRPEAARSAVAIVHGLAEHSGRYDHVGRHLASRGLAAYAIDHRGHGLSAGRRVHVASFDEYLDDVRALLAVVQERHRASVPVLLGHSQGGLVALLYVLRYPQEVRGAVVTSPLIRVHRATRPSAPLRMAAALLRLLAPRLVVPNPLDARLLSHDPAVGPAYDADPLVSHGVSAGWFAALAKAQEEVRRRVGELKVEALVLAGGDDRIVDPEAAAVWARGAPPGLVEFELFDGLYHELLNEPPELRSPVLARMDRWLNARHR